MLIAKCRYHKVNNNYEPLLRLLNIEHKQWICFWVRYELLDEIFLENITFDVYFYVMASIQENI